MFLALETAWLLCYSGVTVTKNHTVDPGRLQISRSGGMEVQGTSLSLPTAGGKLGSTEQAPMGYT